MKRIELTKADVERITLDGRMDYPDMVQFSAKFEGPEQAVTASFEIPSWLLSDGDVSNLRDLSFLNDATVRVVLEVDEE